MKPVMQKLNTEFLRMLCDCLFWLAKSIKIKKEERKKSGGIDKYFVFSTIKCGSHIKYTFLKWGTCMPMSVPPPPVGRLHLISVYGHMMEA